MEKTTTWLVAMCWETVSLTDILAGGEVEKGEKRGNLERGVVVVLARRTRRLAVRAGERGKRV